MTAPRFRLLGLALPHPRGKFVRHADYASEIGQLRGEVAALASSVAENAAQLAQIAAQMQPAAKPKGKRQRSRQAAKRRAAGPGATVHRADQW